MAMPEPKLKRQRKTLTEVPPTAVIRVGMALYGVVGIQGVGGT